MPFKKCVTNKFSTMTIFGYDLERSQIKNANCFYRIHADNVTVNIVGKFIGEVSDWKRNFSQKRIKSRSSLRQISFPSSTALLS